MAATAFPWFDTRFLVEDDTGYMVPAAGYTLDQFESGTTTNQETFTDLAGTIPNALPLILDGDGRCTMYGTPGDVYTFVLKDPTGATVKTWNNVTPAAAPLAGSFVPIDGSVSMTGPLTLPANATSGLEAVPLQQLNDAIAAVTASVAASVASATAAAAAATAAIANVQPDSFSLSSSVGGSATRNVTLQAGTWQCVLETHATKADGGSTYSLTITQAATVGTTTLGTSFLLSRVGGSGYGRDQHGYDMDVQTLTVATTGPFTMAMSSASLSGASSTGSKMTLERIA